MLRPCHILFVCTGNICRSPTAEAIFAHSIQTQNLHQQFTYDSAGVAAYHVGEPPDPRSCDTARQRGVAMDDLRARQVTRQDFYQADVILAMDNGHFIALKQQAPKDASAELALHLDYCGITDMDEVPDPYYGGQKGFDAVYDLLQRANDQLVKRLMKQVS